MSAPGILHKDEHSNKKILFNLFLISPAPLHCSLCSFIIINTKVVCKRRFKSWKENKVAVFVAFSQQLLKSYFRLGQVSVNDCPAELEPPAGARNRRNATVKMRLMIRRSKKQPQSDCYQTYLRKFHMKIFFWRESFT